jgi:MFS family permease
VTQGDDSGVNRDVAILFLARFLRLFAYGLLSVVLVLYLVARGLGTAEVGALLTLTLLGDTAVSLFLTTRADRLGRRRMLVAGALLMVFAVALLGMSDAFLVMAIAATLGIISPSGNEVGPFLPVEQAALAQFVPAANRTRCFAWYNLTGAMATALGSLCAGMLLEAGQGRGLPGVAAYLPLLALYAGLGLALALCFGRLSGAVEAGPRTALPGAQATPTRWGLHRSTSVVVRLSALFALDAFGGGLVIQSVLAYWLSLRFNAGPAEIGALFLGTNILSGLSYLAAGWLAQRIGLLNTMVFTHLPANVLLLLVPLMPDFRAAAALLLVRSLVTQMDVPTRQAYLMAVVSADERSAAAGITGVARSVGAALSPFLATVFAGSAALAGLPFYLAGVLKIAYDLLLYRGFVHLKPEHERPAPTRETSR